MSDISKTNSSLNTEDSSEFSLFSSEEIEEIILRPRCPIKETEHYSSTQSPEVLQTPSIEAPQATTQEKEEVQKIYCGCLLVDPKEIRKMPRPQTPYCKRDFVKDFLSGSPLPKIEEKQLGK